jgi:hypothetical protein
LLDCLEELEREVSKVALQAVKHSQSWDDVLQARGQIVVLERYITRLREKQSQGRQLKEYLHGR